MKRMINRPFGPRRGYHIELRVARHRGLMVSLLSLARHLKRTGENPGGGPIGRLSILQGLSDCIFELFAVVIAHEHVEGEGLS